MWLVNLLERGRALAERIPYSLVALLARFAVAGVFWRSGHTKVEGFFMIKENTFFLFREEYKVPLLPPDTAAYLSTIAEHVFPVLAGDRPCLSAVGAWPSLHYGRHPALRLSRRLAGPHPMGSLPASHRRPRSRGNLPRSSDLEPCAASFRAGARPLKT